MKPNTNATKNPNVNQWQASLLNSVSKVECFKCHEYGHMAAQCLTRNLLVEETQLDDNEFEGIYVAIWNACDSNDDVRAFSIWLRVIRCLHTALRN